MARQHTTTANAMRLERETGYTPDRDLSRAPIPYSDRLSAIAHLAGETHAPELAAEVSALAERLAEGRFYVACVGQFKRGKSTLLNALVGHPLLPVGVVPITTAVTVLRWGRAVRARVRLGADWNDIGADDLALYVSEERNPANRKGVTLVEVFVPSPLLERGMCLVDTPGIGSVIAANSEATKRFVPQVDAALVVLGADPPISGEELQLVAEVAAQVADLVVVQNKADRLTEAERREASAFARKILAQRLGKIIGPIFEVSATERLATGDPSRDWARLEAALVTLSSTTAAALVQAAEARGSDRLARRLLVEIDQQRAALIRPLGESKQHVAALRACVAAAQRAVNDLGPLFTAEQERLSRVFAEQWNAFLAGALPAARTELATAMPAMHGRRDEVRRRALRFAQEVAEPWLDRWRSEAEPAAERLYGEAAQRFADLANEFLERLAAANEALADLPRTVDVELRFRTRSRFYFTDLVRSTTRSPVEWVLDALRPPAAARRAIARAADAHLRDLLSTNAARIVNDFDERVLESRRRLESEIRAQLEAICASAQRALARARVQHAAGSDAVRGELARLDRLRDRAIALGGQTTAPAVPLAAPPYEDTQHVRGRPDDVAGN